MSTKITKLPGCVVGGVVGCVGGCVGGLVGGLVGAPVAGLSSWIKQKWLNKLKHQQMEYTYVPSFMNTVATEGSPSFK